jgi:phospholipid-binding lipoprotein MlaA
MKIPPQKNALHLLGSAVLTLFLAGCASTTSMAPESPADPWENWNRRVFSFNDKLDRAVLKPVATAYVAVVPEPIRGMATNFYGNFGDVWSAVNNVLQGRLFNGLQDVLRVGTNTLFGVAGLVDVATEIGLDKQGKDFGQTLGRWGVGAGPYMILPLLGPSTVRETVALPLDRAVSPSLAFSNIWTQASLISFGLVNLRANLLPTTRLLDDMALDKYSFVREAYLQRRSNLVEDTKAPQIPPPEEPASISVELPGTAASQSVP